MRFLYPLLLLGLAAQAPAPRPATAPDLAHVKYDMYAAGLDVLELRAGIGLNATGYRVEITFRTTGLAGVMVRGRQSSATDGVWAGDQPEPLRVWGDGFWRGTPRHTLIEYDRGIPLVRTLTPPNDEEREPVPVELQAHTMDTLSAMAMLMRRVARTGRCEAEARTFDGRRLADITARTVGEEVLPRTGRSMFAGPALRCDFEGHQLAGFMRDEDRARLMRPHRGSAWFAAAEPGGPLLPVRIAFETRWFGDATMYLTATGEAAVAP